LAWLKLEIKFEDRITCPTKNSAVLHQKSPVFLLKESHILPKVPCTPPKESCTLLIEPYTLNLEIKEEYMPLSSATISNKTDSHPDSHYRKTSNKIFYIL